MYFSLISKNLGMICIKKDTTFYKSASFLLHLVIHLVIRPVICPVICPVIRPVIRRVIHRVIRPVICKVIRPVIRPVICLYTYLPISKINGILKSIGTTVSCTFECTTYSCTVEVQDLVRFLWKYKYDSFYSIYTIASSLYANSISWCEIIRSMFHSSGTVLYLREIFWETMGSLSLFFKVLQKLESSQLFMHQILLTFPKYCSFLGHKYYFDIW